MVKTLITKIATNNYQNSNTKKKKTIKSTPYIQKYLSSKRTSPIKIQMLNVCASPVVFPFKWIICVSLIYKGS